MNNPDKSPLDALLPARVARLATADALGHPHIVPVCFAVGKGQIYIALDAKPKIVPPTRLKRVRNILANPHVALLADTYSEDWSRLAYVLVTGEALLEEVGTERHAQAVRLLRDKYPQYQSMPIESQPVISITPTHHHKWQASNTSTSTPSPHSVLDFAALARSRHVVRRFKPDEVPRALVEMTLEAARWAPSPHGAQPWRFVVVTSADLKERLAEAMASEWQRTLEMDRESADVVASRLRASRSRIVNTPVVVIACLYLEELHRYPDPARQEAETTMAVQSLGAAIQNMLLSAYSLGLDTGWMCAPLFSPGPVRDALSLPTTHIPHALIQLGYGAQDPPRREHRGLEELVLWR